MAAEIQGGSFNVLGGSRLEAVEFVHQIAIPIRESRTPDMGVFENVRFFSRNLADRIVQAQLRTGKDGDQLIEFLAERRDGARPVW